MYSGRGNVTEAKSRRECGCNKQLELCQKTLNLQFHANSSSDARCPIWHLALAGRLGPQSLAGSAQGRSIQLWPVPWQIPRAGFRFSPSSEGSAAPKKGRRKRAKKEEENREPSFAISHQQNSRTFSCTSSPTHPTMPITPKRILAFLSLIAVLILWFMIIEKISPPPPPSSSSSSSSTKNTQKQRPANPPPRLYPPPTAQNKPPLPPTNNKVIAVPPALQKQDQDAGKDGVVHQAPPVLRQDVKDAGAKVVVPTDVTKPDNKNISVLYYSRHAGPYASHFYINHSFPP